MDAGSAATDAPRALLDELSLTAGQYVHEFGYDEDVDHGLRERLEGAG